MTCDNCNKDIEKLNPVRRFKTEERIGEICDNCLTLLMEGHPLKGLEAKANDRSKG